MVYKKNFLSSFKELSIRGSILRAMIYTLGHIIIAMTCNRLITGASFDLAILDAIIEPLINGIWFFMLDRLWSKKTNPKI
ncbi:hypothetical protein LBMAG18_02890 [Alphaproteobacteria bacterium]|nr:hypothetical protein LBMAG18_02890 [Alphaproteobacteria bacterium]